jgi:diguanylate cyclase (GGDEF)-like protein/PAS domain S-box-containing protein
MVNREPACEEQPAVRLDPDRGEPSPAQPTLDANESRFGLMFERTADALMLLDGTTGLFVDCNQATTSMLRCADKKELLALHPSQISPPCQPDGRPSSEKADEMIATALRNGSHRFDWVHCSAHRMNFPVEVLLTPVIVDEQQLILCTLRDITERKQSEAVQTALFRISEAAHSAIDMPDLLHRIHVAIGEFMSARNFYVALYDASTDEISYPYYVDEIDHEPPARRKLDDGLTEVILRNGHSLLLNPETLDDALKSGLFRPHGTRPLDWLGVPLITGTRTIGALVVQSYAGDVRYTEHDKALLEFVSSQIAATVERKQAEAALHASESRFRLMFERTADALMLLDGTTGLFADCNQAAVELLRCQDKNELLQLHPSQISPLRQPDGRLSSEKADEMIATALRNGSHRFEWVHCSIGRADFHAEVLLTPILIDEQNLIIATVRDITRKKESEELIWKQANFDTLTGLPNRRMLHDRLQQAIRKAQRSRLPMALLFVDLDRFKEVNDTLGHHMGDVLLADASERLGSCVRDGDTVARLGGDEFTVILCDLVDVGVIERIAQDILRKLADPFPLRDEVAYVSASIGVTLYPEDATSVEDLLKNADQAMYAAKNQGRNRCCYFTASMQEIAQERMRVIGDLRVALKERQLRVYFQPIMDLASGRIVKAEALLRWQHPQRGLVSPGEFIALAEESGIIHEIGDWVFMESAGWIRRWRSERNRDFQISVNMSPVQFNKGASDHEPWLAHLRRLDLRGDSIVVEITEGQLLHGNTTLDKTLLRFREAGIQVVVDDFGTGSSSLAYVKKFGIDYLKIDKSFIHNLAAGSSDMILSEAIIVMAHTLGMKVIAEGVETKAQHDLLVAAGCDLAQGFLYASPMPPEEFEALLDAQISQ